MDWLQTVFLALLQGITEFLPISSSAHLILPAKLFGWVDQGLAFDVAVHVGTLGAVVTFFRQDLWQMFRAWLRSVTSGQQTQESNLAWYVIIGTIPAGAAGFLLNQGAEELLRSTLVISLATIVFGIILYLADCYGRRQRSISDVNLKDALIIGFAQTLALIPGTSRSGITITAGLALGLDRIAAARFSFLLSVPLIAAAGLLKFIDLLQAGEGTHWPTIILGTAVAFISAYVCIGWFLNMLDKIGMLPFVIYRLLLGVVLLVFFV